MPENDDPDTIEELREKYGNNRTLRLDNSPQKARAEAGEGWAHIGGAPLCYGALADVPMYRAVTAKLEEADDGFQIVVDGVGPTEPEIVSSHDGRVSGEVALQEYVRETDPTTARRAVDTDETPGRAAAADGGEPGQSRAADDILDDHNRGVRRLESSTGKVMELAERAESFGMVDNLAANLYAVHDDVDELVETFKTTGTALEHAHQDLPVVHYDAVERVEVVDEPEAEPVAPAQLPKYLVEGVGKQSSARLRELAEYALAMAAWNDAEAQRQLDERAEADPDGDVPDEWDADAWEDAVDEARESGDVPAGKGTVTTKTIDDRDYFYLQWREGDSVKSQYISPVSPASSDSKR